MKRNESLTNAKENNKSSYFGGFGYQKQTSILQEQQNMNFRSPVKRSDRRKRMKIGTVKLNMSELQRQERDNMKKFLRSARKKGTVNAINDYLQKLEFEPIHEHQEQSTPHSEILTFNDLENLDLDSDEEDDDDSFEEETDLQLLKKKKWLINPNGKFKIIWDHAQLILILYTATLFPFKLGYFEKGDYKIWDMIDYLIDFMFFIDLVMNFFLPFYRKHILILDHSKIALRYLKLWFWVDLLSIFPFELIFMEDSAFFVTLAKLFKTPRIYRIFRLGRLIRTFKAGVKSDTLVVQYILFLIRSEKIVVSIAPIYVFGLIMSHIFACVWHYNSDKSFDSRTWLIRYGFYAEPTHDKFWASLYFVYSTVTTTGYGDITPDTNFEFFQTLIFMFCGVIFYSFVYSSIVSKFTDVAKRNDVYHEKLKMLIHLKKSKLFEGEKYLYREMLFLLDKYREFGMESDAIPPFSNVRPKDRSKLLLEVCKKKYYFGKIDFFSSLPQYLWLYFFENMKEMVYNPEELIFERGAVADFFYVIAQGSVQFMMNSEELKTYPFIETSSYFGEIELFENSTRMWTVRAKMKLIVYILPKNEFFKLLTDPRIRGAFLAESSRRMNKFDKARRECGRALRRVKRAQGKVHKFMAKNKESIQKSIQESKKKSKISWHYHLGEVNDKFQSQKLEEKREEQTRVMIKKLSDAKGGNVGDETEFFKNLNKGLQSKVLLAKRRKNRNIIHPRDVDSKLTSAKKKSKKRKNSLFKNKKSAMKKETPKKHWEGLEKKVTFKESFELD